MGQRSEIRQRLTENGFDPDSPVIQKLIALTTLLYGFPRHLSQHVGGFVITRDKLCRIVPIENAAMPDRRIIQWDKDDLEAVGLMKIDVLALGMLRQFAAHWIWFPPARGIPFRCRIFPRKMKRPTT